MRDFKLETYFSKWEFTAQYHLTASDCESQPIHSLLALACDEDREAFQKLWLGYTETRGPATLRHIIATTYDTLCENDILCFAGAEEGLYIAMKTILQLGDHAIVFTPNYQAAETIPLSICEVTGLALQPENNWEPDIEQLKKLIKPNTRLISINFPHNPTGKIISYANLISLIDICREHGIWLFSDEVYRGVEVEESKRIPQVADIYEKGISLNVMSKAYGLPGLRIGWVACQNHAALEKMHKYKHYLSICNSAPSELLTIIALKAKDKILMRNREIINRNLLVLERIFQDFEDLFEWYRPDGGCVAYPRYRGKEGVDKWAENLVENHGILLLPAHIYHSDLTHTPQDRFRIGFGRDNMDEGFHALRLALSR